MLSGNRHSVVDALSLGHLLKVTAQLVDGSGEILHGTVGPDSGILIFAKGRAGKRDALQQPVEGIFQRGTTDTPLYAGVRHQTSCNSCVLDAVTQRTGNTGRLFEGLAHDADAGIGLGGRCGQNIRKVRCVGGGEAKGSQVVGDNIGYQGQILSGSAGQIDYAVHAGDHLLGIPPGHCHVAHGFGGFPGGILCLRAQLLGHGGQLGHFLGCGAGKGFHVAHAFLEIRCDYNTFQVSVLDFA